MGIKVTNNTNESISACVNQWGNDGDTGYFSIAPGESEIWDRSAEKPFIMLIQKGGNVTAYCVSSKSQIIVSTNGITDQGIEKNPIRP